MEIIKKGEVPEEKEYRVKCNNCSTLFRFKRGEAKEESDFRNGSYLVVKCPVCEQRVYHEL